MEVLGKQLPCFGRERQNGERNDTGRFYPAAPPRAVKM